MKKKIFSLFAALAVIFSACSPGGKKQEQTINISGAFALYPLAVKWSEEYQKANPGIRFNISAGGAGKGMADALSGTVDLGMFSREIAREEKEKGAWWISVARDAVIPTINAKNPVLDILKNRGLTREEFKKIYLTGEIENWKQLSGIDTDLAINVFTRSDACGAAGTWAAYLGEKQEDLKGIGVFGDPGLADAVVKDEKGVGFNNTIYLYNIKTGHKNPGIEVIPVDVDGNGILDQEEAFYDKSEQVLAAIAEGKYPSPPARELYLVSKGEPRKTAVLDFLKWILLKGQTFVPESGYVPLTQSVLNSQVEKLDGK